LVVSLNPVVVISTAGYLHAFAGPPALDSKKQRKKISCILHSSESISAIPAN
jgi:hypothetical protein